MADFNFCDLCGKVLDSMDLWSNGGAASVTFRAALSIALKHCAVVRRGFMILKFVKEPGPDMVEHGEGPAAMMDG